MWNIAANVAKKLIKKIAIDLCNIDESGLNKNLMQFKKRKTHPLARPRLAPAQMAEDRQQPDEEGSNDQAQDRVQAQEVGDAVGSQA